MPPMPVMPKRLPQVDDFPDTGVNALASVRQRGWARVIDTLITDLPLLLLLSAIATTTLDGNGNPTPETDALTQHVPLWVTLGTAVLASTYEIVAIAWRSQTIGKWLLGIRVARFADGKRPGWGQATLRCLLPAVAGAAAFALTGVRSVGMLVVFASAFFNPLFRGWHDDAGGTVVVRTR